MPHTTPNYKPTISYPCILSVIFFTSFAILSDLKKYDMNYSMRPLSFYFFKAKYQKHKNGLHLLIPCL